MISFVAIMAIFVMSPGSQASDNPLSYASQDESQSVFGVNESSVLIESQHLSISTSTFDIGFASETGFVTTAFPRVEYFLLDRFSAGLLLGVTTDFSDIQYLRVGPSFSYYFWVDGQVSAYGGMDYVWANLMDTSSVSGTFGLSGGINYHFLSSFAVGPRLTWQAGGGRSFFELDVINLFVYL